MAEFEAGLISEAEMREFDKLCLVQESKTAYDEIPVIREHVTAQQFSVSSRRGAEFAEKHGVFDTKIILSSVKLCVLRVLRVRSLWCQSCASLSKQLHCHSDNPRGLYVQRPQC